MFVLKTRILQLFIFLLVLCYVNPLGLVFVLFKAVKINETFIYEGNVK